MSNREKNASPFAIRAYCTDCGKLLMESAHMSQKQLMANWDQAVLDAPGIVCEDCDPHRVPNFHIELKIYYKPMDKEFKPEQILPKPKNVPDISTPDFLDPLIQESTK